MLLLVSVKHRAQSLRQIREYFPPLFLFFHSSNTSISTVAANTSYVYQLVVFNTAQSASQSSAVSLSVVTPAAGAAPGSPSAPVLLAFSDITTTISWTPPINVGGAGGLSGYAIVQTLMTSTSTTTGSCSVTYSWASTATTSATFSTTPGRTYSYAVIAQNVFTGTTHSGAASPVLVQVSNSVVGPYPSPVVASNGVVGAGYFGLVLTTVPTALGTGACIPSQSVGYDFQLNNSVNSAGCTSGTVITGSRGGLTPPAFFAVNGLTAATAYTVSVTATNGYAFVSQVSSPISVSTSSTPVVPGPVTTVVSNILSKTSTSISLSWSSPLETGGFGPILSYLVVSGGSTLSTVTLMSGTSSTATVNAIVSGLTTNTAYPLQVVGVNSVGQGPASSFASATASNNNGISDSVTTGLVPGMPTNLVSTAITPTAINLSWTAPTAGSTPLSSYHLRTYAISTLGLPVPTYTSIASSSTNAAVAPISAGTLYRFDINGINSISASGGEYSAPIFAQAPVATTPSVPGQPLTLTLIYMSADGDFPHQCSSFIFGCVLGGVGSIDQHVVWTTCVASTAWCPADAACWLRA